MLQAVETQQYADAAGLLTQANDALASAALTLFDVVGDCYRAAGRGDGAQAWARTYDTSAGEVVQRLSQLVTALGNAGVLLDATGGNHARAEAAAAPYGLPPYALPQRPLRTVAVTGLPSVYGGGDGGEDGEDGAPAGWHWLASRLDGLLWPGADVDRLDRIGSGWLGTAARLREARWLPLGAADAVEAQQSPEVEDAAAVCTRLAAEVLKVADACEALGRQCEAFAAAVRQARETILELVKEFLALTAVSEVTGAVLSFVTAGASELFSKLVETGVVASYAARITAYLRALDLTLNSLVPGLATEGLTDGWLLAVSDAEPVIAALGDAGAAGASAGSAAGAVGRAAQASAAGEAAVTGRRLHTVTRDLLEHWEQTTKSHTIRKHVGKTLDQLRERLTKEPHLSHASSFHDTDEAVSAINETLDRNAGEVQAWLAQGAHGKLPIEVSLDRSVGLVARRSGAVIEGTGARVVLVRDDSASNGVRILTAHPIP